MTKLTIDGNPIEVPNGISVLQACEMAGVEIPRFCFHERLSVAGNCRMCFVEVEKSPKPVASCAFPVAEGMVVKTDSPMVRSSRRGVMEFLLINHPLDCPICDQGGECDLQDQAYSYGRDGSRYLEPKRAVKDKNLGPLVKTVMTRCIQCTRCIRFASEIAGVAELGATERGETMEVGTYVELALTSELSGNLVDICPVGALTSKPYAFVARPWELDRVDGIDVLDATGSNVSICGRDGDVLRILPRVNEDVNEEWLADKGRYAVDGLKRRRLDSPWIKKNGKLVKTGWQAALVHVAERIAQVKGDRIGGVVGDLIDAESALALKDLLVSLGSANLDCRQDGAAFDVSSRDFYLFNSSIAGIEEADAILLIGTNPRREAPVLNARIRKRQLQGGVRIAAIGPAHDLTYPVQWLGDSRATLKSLLAGEGFAATLKNAKKPLIVLGAFALRALDGAALHAAAWKLAADVGALRADWHGFNLLHQAAGRVGALDLGFLPAAGGKNLAGMLGGGVDVLWLLGADEFDTSKIGPDTFVIYQGHHGDRGAARADVILPGAAYTEKTGTYVNTEGRVQRSYAATRPPGEAREDWKILRAFSAVTGKPLPYDDLPALQARLETVNPVFAHLGALPRFGSSDLTGPAAGKFPLSDAKFTEPMPNYYQTDVISRASPTMELCTETYVTAPSSVAAE